MSSPIWFWQMQANNYFNLQPSQVKGQVNTSTSDYKRILYNEAFSVFNFNIPKWWKLNWFRFWLFQYGSISLVYTKKYGWICQPYSVVKFDYQWNPRDIVVYNPLVSEKEIAGVIGVNAAIIHLFDDFFGIDDIVSRYAELLAQTERSLNVTLMNSNVTAFFEAESKKQAEEVKEAYTEATKGNPFTVLNKNVMKDKSITTLLPNVKNNFIGLDVLEVRRGIINEFLTRIGIRNVSVQKKERLTQGEVSENNDETKALASVMLKNMRNGFDMFNSLSGQNASVDLAYNYEIIPSSTKKEK